MNKDLSDWAIVTNMSGGKRIGKIVDEQGETYTLEPCYEYLSEPQMVQTPQGIQIAGRIQAILPYDNILETFPVHVTATEVLRLEELPPQSLVQFSNKIEAAEQAIAAERAKQNSGIILAGAEALHAIKRS